MKQVQVSWAGPLRSLWSCRWPLFPLGHWELLSGFSVVCTLNLPLLFSSLHLGSWVLGPGSSSRPSYRSRQLPYTPTNAMPTRLSSLILATFAPGVPLLTCMQAWATCSSHVPGSQGSLNSRVSLPLNMTVLPPSKAKSAQRMHVVWCCWPSNPTTLVGHQEIFFALTGELINQNVHSKFNMGISSQPTQSAKDS